MENKNVLISGAGIAGLTLAYWLKKHGFTPTIVEKHPSLRTEGYKLDIRGVAVEVIRRMGLQPAIFAARTDILKAQFVDHTGKIVTETTPDLCGVRAEGDLEIVRGSLCQILFERVRDTEFIFDDSIKNISQTENGVHVEFSKHENRVFDLVVGADGLHSKVRKLCFGEEPQFLRELGLYVSFYSIPNFLQLDRVEIEYHAHRRFAIAYCPKDGLAKAGFAFSVRSHEFNLSEQKQQQEFLQTAYAGEGWEIPRLLAYMQESPDFYFDCIAQVHMPNWTKGRIALVGDAGYAVSPLAGQGSSVALVGAYVLAGELAEAHGGYVQAFQRYEENLRGFVEKNQKLAKMSVALMDGEGTSWIKTKISDLIYKLGRLIPGSLIQFFKNRGLKQTAIAANAIKLKDYQSG